ncbi:MAG: type I 3-dehydroquinate dehydratase [Acidobacteriota bacterium]|nr:type I 3-dehydroquinate dehydratase [Acidobacteriota bacterium]
MKPCVESPIKIRGLEFGGPQPLFCVPLVAATPDALAEQARAAHALSPDLVEWRADFSADLSPEALAAGARLLREILTTEAIVFTLRIQREGGAQAMAQAARQEAIAAVLRSGCVDIVDLELANEPEFLDVLMALAKRSGVRVILAFHDFTGTPANQDLSGRIAAMHARGADIAKIAVMPREAGDVLRLFQVTVAARAAFPAMPLAVMSMGGLGSITRVAGFLYGSDMAFAVAKESSAPGQIPLADARRMAEMILRYS